MQHEEVFPTIILYAFLFSTTRALSLAHKSFTNLFTFNKLPCNLKSSSLCNIEKFPSYFTALINKHFLVSISFYQHMHFYCD